MGLMNEAQAVLSIVAITGAARAKFPVLDSLLVIALDCALGVGLAYLLGQDAGVRATIQHGLLMGLSAAGGLKGGAYVVGKALQVAKPQAPEIEITPIDEAKK